MCFFANFPPLIPFSPSPSPIQIKIVRVFYLTTYVLYNSPFVFRSRRSSFGRRSLPSLPPHSPRAGGHPAGISVASVR